MIDYLLILQYYRLVIVLEVNDVKDFCNRTVFNNFNIQCVIDIGVLYKKVFLEISQNSQENICARVSFLIKLHASGLRLATLLKKRLWCGAY